MEINPFLGTFIGNIIIAILIIILIKIVGLFKDKIIKYIDYLTSITVGLLLAIVFLGFLPEMLHSGEKYISFIGIFILIGLLFFYVLELIFHWHHCKDLDHKGHDCCSHGHSEEHKNNFLMFAGTLIHNAFHGIVLFSSFSVDFYFGIATSIVIFLHAVPQNIANYIMNHNNPKYTYLAAIGGILGAVLTYPLSNLLIEYQVLAMAFISGILLYTALTDILPEVKDKPTISLKLRYFLFIIIGVIIFVGFQKITGYDSHNHNEKHEEHEKSN